MRADMSLRRLGFFRAGFLSLVALFFLPSVAPAQLKKLPPPGMRIEPSQKERLLQRLAVLKSELSAARSVTRPDEDAVEAEVEGDADWGVHVQVLLRSVDLALRQGLFYKPAELDHAWRILDEAERRIVSGREGVRGLELLGFSEDRNQEAQPLVGGFVSRIDDSVQPFGMVIPAGYRNVSPAEPIRTDVWLHGRGDTKTEIPFITERMTKAGQYVPDRTVVIHPFGRHCNAFKFAGETDVDESIAAAGKLVNVDDRRLSIRGFSMGGAGCWHLAVHDPTRWMAANPGAGFVDTIRYQGWSAETPFELTSTAKKLLRWYDVLPWTENLSMTNVIAYSGEKDKQKMAADRVAENARQHGIEFPYVIGKDMGHKIDDPSKKAIATQLNEWAVDGRPAPRSSIRFVTYTLKYDRADWLRVTGMEQHWSPARVEAQLESDPERIKIRTEGVTALEIDFAESGWPGRKATVDLDLDGETYGVQDTGNGPGFQCRLMKEANGEWVIDARDPGGVRKRPGLQGPIDDAFCDRFVVVVPSRPARHGRVQRWMDREFAYFKSRWERLMRGRINVVRDNELTEDQIQTCHLICFGDFSSNRYLFKVAGELPVTWTRESLRVGEGAELDASKHVPVFCCPNPLNPSRYLVVNSGMTFREFSNTSNSRQIAMLPDWAVLDVTADEDSIYAGEIISQGFFDEEWRWAGADRREKNAGREND